MCRALAALFGEPVRTYTVLFLLTLAAGAASVFKDESRGEGAAYFVGAVGWTAFWLLVLVTLTFTAARAVLRVVRWLKS